MKLHPLALGLTCGLLWGGAVLVVALLNTAWPGYGVTFLECVSSIYPGFHPSGAGAAVVGGLYGLVDGAVGGLLLAWLYNLLAPRPSAA